MGSFILDCPLRSEKLLPPPSVEDEPWRFWEGANPVASNPPATETVMMATLGDGRGIRCRKQNLAALPVGLLKTRDYRRVEPGSRSAGPSMNP